MTEGNRTVYVSFDNVHAQVEAFLRATTNISDDEVVTKMELIPTEHNYTVNYTYTKEVKTLADNG